MAELNGLTIDVDARQLVHEITVTVRIRHAAEAHWRAWLAGKILRLAAIVGGFRDAVVVTSAPDTDNG